MQDKNSIFYYFQKIINLRKSNPIIIYGNYDIIQEEHDQIFAYIRSFLYEKLLVVVNMSNSQPLFTWNEHKPSNIISYTLLLNNYNDFKEESNQFTTNFNIKDIESFVLQPYEARVYLLKINSH